METSAATDSSLLDSAPAASPHSPSRRGRQPVEVVVVGAGRRSNLYASFAQQHPDRMRIVGVVDPDETARQRIASRYNLPREHTFANVAELVSRPPIGRAVINGTMDRDHLPTTLPLLEAGYDVLLEKPICTRLSELKALSDAAARHGRRVMICHVLRYAPFYQRIHELVRQGAVGPIRAIHMAEYVSYHHMATAFVRGPWNRTDTSSPMLLAKCCHDLDLLCWLAAPQRPAQVASFGGRTLFRPDLAPPGAGTRCVTDCAIERSCHYSAKQLYVEQRLWSSYVWGLDAASKNMTDDQKLQSLATDNPYGRCVWRCDNDVVDQQKLIVHFDGGVLATHEMIGGTARGGRIIHICGDLGEIQGRLEDGRIELRRPSPDAPKRFTAQTIELPVAGEMHGGGDLRLVDDFLRVVEGEPPSPSTTALEDSIQGHLLAFAADQAMQTKQTIDITEFWRMPTE